MLLRIIISVLNEYGLSFTAILRDTQLVFSVRILAHKGVTVGGSFRCMHACIYCSLYSMHGAGDCYDRFVQKSLYYFHAPSSSYYYYSSFSSSSSSSASSSSSSFPPFSSSSCLRNTTDSVEDVNPPTAVERRTPSERRRRSCRRFQISCGPSTMNFAGRL